MGQETSTSSARKASITMSAQQKDLRLDRLNRLEDKINQTKKVVDSNEPGVRILTRKLMEMKSCFREYEDAHMTYITKERNEEDKKTATDEHTTWVDKYDEVSDPAEGLLETLEKAALPDPLVPLAQQKDLIKNKIDSAYKISNERIKRLKDFLDDDFLNARTNEAHAPNTAQLEKFDSGISHIRAQLDAEYNPLFGQLEECCATQAELKEVEEKKKGIRETLTLELDNTIKFGPDVEWVNDNLNYEVNVKRKDIFAKEILKYLPSVDVSLLQASYSGIRPIMNKKDKKMSDFIINTAVDHNIAGLINLYGIESPGLTSSLSLAKLIAKQII